MNRIILILLTATIFLQALGSVVILASYQINKEYISRNLCENRNKPSMHCDGKCHLQKQLKEQEKKERTPGSNTKEKQETVQFFENDIAYAFNLFANKTPFNSYYLLNSFQSVSFSIFHPPIG